ncbi:MAG: hypothetical protein Q4B06_01000 [Candidatus Saccharibacteria bacterium]|nr:hypothetical protein [Candidatus Saccharibacteria bacterium]
MKQQRYESGGSINNNEQRECIHDKARRLIATAAVSSVAIFGLSACGSEQDKPEGESVSSSTAAELPSGEYVTTREEDARYFAEIAEKHEALQESALAYFEDAFANDSTNISMDTVRGKSLGGQTDIEVRDRLVVPNNSTWGQWRVATLDRSNGDVATLEESLDWARYTVEKMIPQEAVVHQHTYGGDSVLTFNDGYAKGPAVLLTNQFALPLAVDGKDVSGVLFIARYKDDPAYELETAEDAVDRFVDEKMYIDEMVIKMTDGSEVATNRDQLMYLTKEFDISQPAYGYKGERARYEDTLDRYDFAAKVMEAM